MNFTCSQCDQRRDFFLDYGICVISAKKEFRHICRLCRKPRGGVPDVYWDGKPEEGLADDPVTGKPRVFGSKGEKAAYLKERGLQEAGDRMNGAPPSILSQAPQRTDSRHEVRMALKKVREMGRDVRRQEYLRITKEGRRYA